MVSIAPSDGPIAYHLYDAESGQSQFLFPHRKQLAALPSGKLAPMEPF